MNTQHNFSKTLSLGTSKRKATCAIHGEYTPIIASHPHCEICAQAAIEAHRQATVLEDFKRSEAARFAAAGIPTRYTDSGFKNYKTDQAGQIQALSTIKNYAMAVRCGHIGSMVFTGPTGTGKTHLAVSVLKNVMARNGSSTPLFAKYFTSADLIEHVRNAWKREGDSDRATMYRLTVEVDLLILDEYGLDDQDPKVKCHVDRVLRARYDNRKPTLLISNETPDKLKAMLGDRVWSRLIESNESRIVKFNWADQRGIA